MKKSQYSLASTDETEDETPYEFPEIDQIGLYTLVVYLVLSTPLILSSIRGLGYIFTTGKVNYRCLITECENSADAIYLPSWLSNAVPYTDHQPETCTRYIVQNITDSCSTTVFANETESCNAWIYDSAEITILNEWNLTCENNLWKLTLPGTINNFGQFVGCILFSRLSDTYGRRKLLVACTIGSAILGIIQSFSVNYWMFIIFEFLSSFVGSCVYSATFVLGMEFVGPKKRILASNVSCSMYVVYAVFLGLFSMWLRSWRLLQRVFYIPGLFMILMPCVVPESIRWLLSKGKTKEAEIVLRKFAAGNKLEITEKSIEVIRNWKNEINGSDVTNKGSKISPIKEILGNKRVLTRLIICTFCWMSNAFVYYGLSLGSVTVPGNKYVNFILTMGIEIPAMYATWFLAEYLGRKPTLSLTYFLSGVFCVITLFVPPDWWQLPIIVFLGGKFCISVAYHLLYIFTTELFPTSLRHSVIGLCSMVGRIGSTLAPQLPLLAYYIPSLPLTLFAVMAILASLLSLSFPETLGIKLPDTVYEAENIGKTKKKERSTSACKNRPFEQFARNTD